VDAARKFGIRLNLGCGHVALEGYINVDRRALPGVDIVAEVDDLPFTAGQVAEIFSAHLIEHFPQEQLRRTLLRYWRDLLRPGGIFRVVAPDAEGMMQAYYRGEYPFERLREVTFGGQDYNGDFHYNMLNTKSLTELLLAAGFVDVNVIAENRENGGCKEFEIAARRPEAE
jgi:predicted SAM-dependent methyltransferase